jgi:hypothetical protein
MAQSLIEPDFAEPYAAWKAQPGPAANAAILKTLHPTIEGAIRTHVGAPNPLLYSRARRMALEGLRGYDPSRGRLQTHLYNHLLGLKRVNRQQTQILGVPERVALDHYHLGAAERELAHELGREPTDGELSDRTGFSAARLTRVRSYRPGVAEGTLEEAGQPFGGAAAPSGQDMWFRLVYDDLPDAYHRKVMELGLGLNGHRVHQNQEIARRLGRSPGAISQAKARIQAMLDQEPELSPFFAG